MAIPKFSEQFRDGRLDAVVHTEQYALDGRAIPSYGPDIALIDHHDRTPGQRQESVFPVATSRAGAAAPGVRE